MAERPIQRPNAGLYFWETLTASDTGVPIRPTNRGAAIAAVQFNGTFGGTVVLQGSLDGVNWYTLKDTQGTDISVTAAGYREFSSAARYIRPSAGSGVSDVDVRLSLGL